jgi:hypothetical protein
MTRAVAGVTRTLLAQPPTRPQHGAPPIAVRLGGDRRSPMTGGVSAIADAVAQARRHACEIAKHIPGKFEG